MLGGGLRMDVCVMGEGGESRDVLVVLGQECRE